MIDFFVPQGRPPADDSGSAGFAALEARPAVTTMHLTAQYRQFAADYRRLAAMLTKPADKQALELFAAGWDRIAENREVLLRSEGQNLNQSTCATSSLFSPRG
jgi:hypothetical protein